MAVYIEYHLARHAQGLPDATDGKKSERLLTNALGVLNEQGVYALFLYLRGGVAKKDEAVAKQIGAGVLKFLADREIHADVAWSVAFRQTGRVTAIQFDDHDLFTKFRTLCKSRDDLFYAHGLLEQLLTYARYHAKALPDKKKQNVSEQEKTRREPPLEAVREVAPEPPLEAGQEIPSHPAAPTPRKTSEEETGRSPRVLGKIDLSKQK